MNATQERKLPTVNLRTKKQTAFYSKRAEREFDAWTARIEAENLHVGLMVTAARVITDSRDYVLHTWWEPAVITELRNFDAVVKFQDGTTQSSGLGLRAFELPAI
jgi:hypothetical protein